MLTKRKIGGQIKAARESRGWTQARLAAELGVTKPAISQWESGLRTPKGEYLYKITKLFSVSMDYLMGEEETKSSGLFGYCPNLAAA